MKTSMCRFAVFALLLSIICLLAGCNNWVTINAFQPETTSISMDIEQMTCPECGKQAIKANWNLSTVLTINKTGIPISRKGTIEYCDKCGYLETTGLEPFNARVQMVEGKIIYETN